MVMKKVKLNTAQLAVVLAAMTILSKVLGFVRELFLANYFGAGYVTDSYVMSMSIPNNLLAGIVGATMTAYMPVFSRKVEANEKDGQTFTSQLINFLLCVTCVAAVLGGIFAKQLVGVFAPGFTGDAFDLTVFYTRIAFVMVIFSVLTNILGGYLQYKGVFIPQNFLAYIQNVFIITAIIISAKLGVPKILIFGITAGYIAMGLGTLFIANRNGYAHELSFQFSDSVKDVVAMAIPVFIGTSISEINALVDRMLASGLPTGSVSALQYGNIFSGMVSSFTVGIFVTIIYPRLAKAFSLKEYETVSEVSEKGINLIVLLMLPMTLGSMVYSNQVVQVVYERGAFSAAATDLTASAFFYYSIAMAFNGVRSLLDKVFFSAHDSKTPVICSGVALVLNIILNLILVKPMAHAGLALATSISNVVATVLLYVMFKKKFPQITLLSSFKKIGKIAVFSVISVGASYAFYYFVGNAIWMPRMVLLGASVLIACIIYFIFLYVARFEELNLIKDMIFRRNKEA